MPRAELAFLTVTAAVYLGLSLYHVDLPGVYGDEAYYLAPTVSLLTGQPFIGGGWYETVFGYRILLALTERIGPIQSYLPMPFVLLLGYTPLAIRLPAVLCGLGTLIAAYVATRLWCGAWTARFGILLTAVSAEFVFGQRMANYSYGQITLFTSLVFLFLALQHATGDRRYLWLAAAGAGLAVDLGPHSLIPLVGIGLVWAMAPGWRPVAPRDGVTAVGLFLLAGLPMIGVTLKTSDAFARAGWTGAGASSFSLAAFVEAVAAHALNLRGLLVGVDAIQATAVGGAVVNVWMIHAFVASLLALALGWLASPRKREFAARCMAPMVVTLVGLGLTGFIVNSRISYQLIMLWPFAPLTIGAGLAVVSTRTRWLGIALAGGLAVSQLVTTLEVHAGLTRVRGRGTTTAQIYPLARYLEAGQGRRVMAMDWGLNNQLYFLTGGTVRADHVLQGWWPRGSPPPPDFVAGVRREIANPDTAYVFRGPGEGFDRFPQFTDVVQGAGRRPQLEREFREPDGEIAYRVYRVVGPR
jgi:hypothetical protein